mgnify:CR=1 FL=1
MIKRIGSLLAVVALTASLSACCWGPHWGGGHRLDGHNSQVPVAGMQVVGKGLRIATPCTLRKPENHINQSCFR